jgi:hypothetical protein
MPIMSKAANCGAKYGASEGERLDVEVGSGEDQVLSVFSGLRAGMRTGKCAAGYHVHRCSFATVHWLKGVKVAVLVGDLPAHNLAAACHSRKCD